MKILLLGANGQLGQDIQKIAPDNVEIEAITRNQLDISELNSISDFLANKSFDVLVNCTSYHKTDEVESNAKKAFDINAFAVKAMAKACENSGARFIHISTDYVFGGDKHDSPLTENAMPAPLNVYGASKLMGENLAKANCVDTVIFRVASLFGTAGASGKGGNFVETMIRFGKEKGHLKVVNDQYMSPTSTLDIADILFKFLSANGPAGTYNVVNSGQASWYEFAKKIIEKSGVNATVDPVPATEYPTPALRPSYSVLSNKKVGDIIQQNIPTWETALERYLVEKGHLQPA